jgi:uncharacterized protein (DUF608 family)
LSWDDPYVQFGSKGKPVAERTPAAAAASTQYPRYYTRFFGASGLASADIACYALLQAQDWRQRIRTWQESTLRAGEGATQDSDEGGEGAYYDSQLFNELYFLVDGGTVWVDSAAGLSNRPNNPGVLPWQRYIWR